MDSGFWIVVFGFWIFYFLFGINFDFEFWILISGFSILNFGFWFVDFEICV